jgi:hypothetical protein
MFDQWLDVSFARGGGQIPHAKAIAELRELPAVLAGQEAAVRDSHFVQKI